MTTTDTNTEPETETAVEVPQAVIGIPPTTRYTYNGVISAIYIANTGKGLPRHEHGFAHTTVCIQGRMVVRKKGKQVELTPRDAPLLLAANEWHEIEALEPNTIFMNQSSTIMGEA